MNELREALDAIDPDARQALELAYFGGLDIHAIADIVGRPVHELRPALREALLALAAATRHGQSPRLEEPETGQLIRRSR